MKGTRGSLARAVEEARGCGQGHLFGECGEYFFLIAQDTIRQRIWSNFWATVQWMDAEFGDDHETALDWLSQEMAQRGC